MIGPTGNTSNTRDVHTIQFKMMHVDIRWLIEALELYDAHLVMVNDVKLKRLTLRRLAGDLRTIYEATKKPDPVDWGPVGWTSVPFFPEVKHIDTHQEEIEWG